MRTSAASSCGRCRSSRALVFVTFLALVSVLAWAQGLPKLSVKPGNSGIAVIAWPYTNSPFVFQERYTLQSTSAWAFSAAPASFIPTNSSFAASVSATNPAAYYRLAQPADLRGLYVYVPLDTAPNAPAAAPVVEAINLPGIDGMLIVGLWSSVETNYHQFDWSHLDKWMSYAASHDKKVNLVIRAGDGTPDWLFAPPPQGPGATKLTFTISPKDGRTKTCQTDVIAIPWEAPFLSSWGDLLSNLAAHLHSTGVYTNVTLLRLTGINRTSDELRLPAETPDNNPLTGTGLECVSNAPAIWQAHGYTPANLLLGWSNIVNAFEANFPDKSFSVAIIPNPPQVPFPPIDQNGQIITENLPDQNQPLLELASERLLGRLVVQFNFLMTSNPAQPAVIYGAQQYGSLPAFQANDWFAREDAGSACGGSVTNPLPCVDSSYLNMLEQGIYPLGQNNPLRSQYLEVWATNAVVFTNAIWQAHRELFSAP